MDDQNLSQPKPEEQEGSENLGQENKETPPQIDWENEGNPYRKQYHDSQSQIQPLVRTLQQFAEYDHQTKSWKPKTTAPASAPAADDAETILSGYDPEFVKALGGYTQKQINAAIAKFHEQNASVQEYNSQMTAGRSKAMDEFGTEFGFVKDGKMDTASPLYQLANEIIHSKYALFNPDGTFAKYSTPEAEYLATVEAYAILAKRAKQPPVDKGRLSAIAGKGTKAAGVKGQIPYEEYSKLSDVEKDAYDLAQKG